MANGWDARLPDDGLWPRTADEVIFYHRTKSRKEIEFLFMNGALFEGPVARAMGGADVAWEVAVVVAGGLYYLYRRYYAVAPTVVPESVSASG